MALLHSHHTLPLAKRIVSYNTSLLLHFFAPFAPSLPLRGREGGCEWCVYNFLITFLLSLTISRIPSGNRC